MHNYQYQLPVRTIFRAYDIRGIVETELNNNVIYTIGLALGTIANTIDEQQFIVARDGRLSSPDLSQALIQGLIDSGREVIDIGLASSPMMYFSTHYLTANSGIMITGSHNPDNYNGLKIIIAGKTLTAQEVLAIYHQIKQQVFYYASGNIRQDNILNAYYQAIKQQIILEKPLKIVVDSGNGVMGNIAPKLLKALGCDVVSLFCEVDGNFPNHHPDPSEAKNLQDLMVKVKQVNADLGIAFDGDGDRLGVVTNQGEIIVADQILMLLAKHLLSQHPDATIVFDIKCSMHLARLIHSLGGKPIMWKTGHSHIKQKMQESGALLAGEMSGHIFYKDRWYGFDDGLYTACRLLELLASQSSTLSELYQELPKSIASHELKIQVDEQEKFSLVEQFQQSDIFNQGKKNLLDGLRVEYEHGWGLLRASNTSPNLTVRFEAETQQALLELQALFKRALQMIDQQLTLPELFEAP